MGWGNLVGTIADKTLGLDGFGQLVGAGYDLSMADQAAQQRSDQLNADLALRREMLQDSRSQNAATQQKINQFSEAMKQMQSQLGPRAIADPRALIGRYQQLREQNMVGLNRLIDQVASQTRASSIRNGMDISTLNDDAAAAVVSKFAPEIYAANNAAFDTALKEYGGIESLTNTSRSNILDETAKVQGSAISPSIYAAMAGANTAKASGPDSYAYGYASSAGSNLGKAQEDFLTQYNNWTGSGKKKE